MLDFKSQRWPLILELPALTLKSNERVKVPVYASNYENISGWQGTLEFEPGLIEIISVQTMKSCLLYTSPSPRDRTRSRMPSSA